MEDFPSDLDRVIEFEQELFRAHGPHVGAILDDIVTLGCELPGDSLIVPTVE